VDLGTRGGDLQLKAADRRRRRPEQQWRMQGVARQGRVACCVLLSRPWPIRRLPPTLASLIESDGGLKINVVAAHHALIFSISQLF
jgi:hypothetical protein